jgi:hypothetical protein
MAHPKIQILGNEEHIFRWMIKNEKYHLIQNFLDIPGFVVPLGDDCDLFFNTVMGYEQRHNIDVIHIETALDHEFIGNGNKNTPSIINYKIPILVENMLMELFSLGDATSFKSVVEWTMNNYSFARHNTLIATPRINKLFRSVYHRRDMIENQLYTVDGEQFKLSVFDKTIYGIDYEKLLENNCYNTIAEISFFRFHYDLCIDDNHVHELIQSLTVLDKFIALFEKRQPNHLQLVLGSIMDFIMTFCVNQPDDNVLEYLLKKCSSDHPQFFSWFEQSMKTGNRKVSKWLMKHLIGLDSNNYNSPYMFNHHTVRTPVDRLDTIVALVGSFGDEHLLAELISIIDLDQIHIDLLFDNSTRMGVVDIFSSLDKKYGFTTANEDQLFINSLLAGDTIFRLVGERFVTDEWFDPEHQYKKNFELTSDECFETKFEYCLATALVFAVDRIDENRTLDRFGLLARYCYLDGHKILKTVCRHTRHYNNQHKVAKYLGLDNFELTGVRFGVRPMTDRNGTPYKQISNQSHEMSAGAEQQNIYGPDGMEYTRLLDLIKQQNMEE